MKKLMGEEKREKHDRSLKDPKDGLARNVQLLVPVLVGGELKKEPGFSPKQRGGDLASAARAP